MGEKKLATKALDMHNWAIKPEAQDIPVNSGDKKEANSCTPVGKQKGGENEEKLQKKEEKKPQRAIQKERN